jgi:hypothetical protein
MTDAHPSEAELDRLEGYEIDEALRRQQVEAMDNASWIEWRPVESV